MSPIERVTPPLTGTETEVLVGMLGWHRDTLRIKTDGLDAGQLDQRLEPSTMTLGGMLKHMAYVEDWWFNQVFAGNPEPEPWASVDWDADNDWDWHSATEDTPERAARAAGRGDRRLRPDTPRGTRLVGRPGCAGSDAQPAPSRPTVQPALGRRTHARGVRPAQRPRRPDPRVHRRPGGRIVPPTGHSTSAVDRRAVTRSPLKSVEWSLIARPRPHGGHSLTDRQRAMDLECTGRRRTTDLD